MIYYTLVTFDYGGNYLISKVLVNRDFDFTEYQDNNYDTNLVHLMKNIPSLEETMDKEATEWMEEDKTELTDDDIAVLWTDKNEEPV